MVSSHNSLMNGDDHLPATPNKDVPAFDAAHARAYAEGPPRQVPGFASLHRMTSMLLAEHVPANGRVLVLGAGGGLELKALADDHAGWTFDGVDPSADMLGTAAHIVGTHSPRVRLHQGYIDAAPEGPFDGAVCLLTFHFVARDQRLCTLRQVRRRLVPGASFVVAHISFPQTEPERSLWISRHVAFGGTAPANVESAKQAIATKLTILSPEEDEALLHEAGFSGVNLFYAGLSFRGWVAYA
jgi:tRNA (cmo5U34)-methyltransferase